MPKFGLDNIQIKLVDVYFDEKTNTNIRETANLLSYESQHFNCNVEIKILPGEADKRWSIGLVQACDHMFLENRYGDVGSSYWEFHPLKSGRHSMVNDSDGVQYPFYCSTTSKIEIPRGFVEESVQSLHYEDHFYPTVAWELPYCQNAKLTEVIRQQNFWVWFVAVRRGGKNCDHYNFFNPLFDQVFVLKTMRWKYNLQMSFDKNKPPGEKLIGIQEKQTEYPIVLNFCKPLPLSALSPPHCNGAQSLIWYPNDKNEKTKVLVAPRQIITPWEIWKSEMGNERTIKAQRPKYCKFVGEWPSQTNKNRNNFPHTNRYNNEECIFS